MAGNHPHVQKPYCQWQWQPVLVHVEQAGREEQALDLGNKEVVVSKWLVKRFGDFVVDALNGSQQGWNGEAHPIPLKGKNV